MVASYLRRSPYKMRRHAKKAAHVRMLEVVKRVTGFCQFMAVMSEWAVQNLLWLVRLILLFANVLNELSGLG
jgi:hypothetical protein